MSFALAINILAALFTFFILGCLLGAIFSPAARKKLAEIAGNVFRRDLSLSRISLNPVLRPGKTLWEAEAVFNPAALALGGRTHLIYRAIGADGLSRLGYASSANGLTFTDRLPHPVYIAQNPRAGLAGPRRYAPTIYPSGGSWGGCEDPRMVAINGRVYVSFQMFDGWDFIRLAVISIPESDFLAKRFYNWSAPTLISPPGQVHKNWVLFPEKITGQFAILHSVSPRVEIAYRDSIEGIGGEEPFIESWVGARGGEGRDDSWDTFVRGAGPPPLRTEEGWLLFYHAIDKREPGRYKLGVMLLDLNDPTKILYRSRQPVLVPDESYENSGKPGIVYACGAVLRGDMLYVYYGGADKVVCAAFAPLATFLAALKSDAPTLTSAPLSTR